MQMKGLVAPYDPIKFHCDRIFSLEVMYQNVKIMKHYYHENYTTDFIWFHMNGLPEIPLTFEFYEDWTCGSKVMKRNVF